MAESNSYEEQRRRQMEENRRKLEELRLHHLSAAVREAAARPKPNPKPRPVRQILSLLLPCLRSPISFFSPTYMTAAQKRKAPEPGEIRRSGRVAGLPEQPSYLEGAGQRDYRGVYEAYAVWKGPTEEERAGAIAKAEELQRRIHRIRCPAFVKPMTHNCASKAAEMKIPKHFSEYLPAHDEGVVLVDKADDEFHMMYNAHRQGRHYYFHKGWRGFAANHDLAVGDCLVFHMTERAKFKVYIFRANPDYESDQTSDDSEDEE
uniref:TF-B3 domain-containing protein n=1 Tax=Triticum urartu TaxID=4572 RepID=A0A8R7Q986_TRIUA